MAVNIDKDNIDIVENNLATQGSVVNTFKSYNEQIKKEYNDKIEDSVNNDTLQKSLYTIVKSLDKSNTIKENFESNVSLEGLSSDNSEKTIFRDSGLIRKLDIISKAITPAGADISNWDDNICANDLSESNVSDQTKNNVPVIAYTKGYEINPYETNKEFNHDFFIKGQEIESYRYVLSEKQIADMVLTVSKDIIEDYTVKIAKIRDMVRLNNAKLIGILNYIIRSNSQYTDYFPVSVGYHEDLENHRNYYEFVTLNSTIINIGTIIFDSNNDKIFLTINKKTNEIMYSSVEVNEGDIATYCNITLTDGKFIVRESTNPEDKGYELLLENHPFYIIINSDIDLSIMNYEILINGNPRKIVRDDSDILYSDTRNFKYKVEILSIEGQNIKVEFPYNKYKETDFKSAIYKINDEVITEDKSIFLITDDNIMVDISDINTKKITYFSGFNNK